MDIKQTNENITIDHNKVRKALIRAYMKGENSTHIDTKQFIQDLANHIKGYPNT
ncbi:hypothetical protein ACLM5H_20780 [Fredinandcohnia humi]